MSYQCDNCESSNYTIIKYEEVNPPEILDVWNNEEWIAAAKIVKQVDLKCDVCKTEYSLLEIIDNDDGKTKTLTIQLNNEE